MIQGVISLRIVIPTGESNYLAMLKQIPSKHSKPRALFPEAANTVSEIESLCRSIR